MLLHYTIIQHNSGVELSYVQASKKAKQRVRNNKTAEHQPTDNTPRLDMKQQAPQQV